MRECIVCVVDELDELLRAVGRAMHAQGAKPGKLTALRYVERLARERDEAIARAEEAEERANRAMAEGKHGCECDGCGTLYTDYSVRNGQSLCIGCATSLVEEERDEARGERNEFKKLLSRYVDEHTAARARQRRLREALEALVGLVSEGYPREDIAVQRSLRDARAALEETADVT